MKSKRFVAEVDSLWGTGTQTHFLQTGRTPLGAPTADRFDVASPARLYSGGPAFAGPDVGVKLERSPVRDLELAKLGVRCRR